jgi:chromosome segregation ATPase
MHNLIILTVVAAILSTAIVFGSLIVLQKRLFSSAGEEREALVAKIEAQDRHITKRLETLRTMGSRAQFDSVVQQIQEIQATMQAEKAQLQEIEVKLEHAQREVEAKESAQQDVKSSKEEDEAKLADLMGRYSDISSESVMLEQSLASSLKHLDTILVELDLTDDQKSLLSHLADALVSAGGRLRDLITEYEAVNKRLSSLMMQHKDLEEEYTKLVEQQLCG